MLYDIDRFTGETIRLPLGFKILTCKDGDHICEAVIEVLQDFDESMKHLDLTGIPYLARIAHGCFDRGRNEGAGFKKLADRILKLRNSLISSGWTIARWDRVLKFACNAHANSSKISFDHVFYCLVD